MLCVMSLKHGPAHPQRSPRRSPGRGAESRAPRMTFGPGPALAFTTLFCLVPAWTLLSRLPDLKLSSALLGISVGAFGLFLPLFAWERYRLGAEALERRTISRRDRWRWSELGGVKGAAVNRAGTAMFGEALAGIATESMRTADVGRRLMRYEISDRWGHFLFRISPWIRNRQRLAAEIRRRTAAARRE